MRSVVLDLRLSGRDQPGERRKRSSRPKGGPVAGTQAIPVEKGIVTLVESDKPDVLTGEVRLAVEACSLCGSDYSACHLDPSGKPVFSGPLKSPVILGHELAGTVESVGAGVTRVRVGDLVAVESVLSCWSCDTCLSGYPAQCERGELLGMTRNGGLADYVSVPERACFPLESLLRDGLPRNEAAVTGALIEPMGAAYSALCLSDRGVIPGDSLVVYGLGGLGMLLGSLARIAGCYPIIGVDRDESRVKWAVTRWFDDGIAVDTGSTEAGAAAAEIGRRLGRIGADIQIDVSGSTDTVMPIAQRLLAPGGRLVVMSRTRNTVPTEVNPWVSSAASIQGLRGRVDARAYPRVIALFSGGRLSARDHVTRFVPLEAVPAILMNGGEPQPGKTMVMVAAEAPW